MQGAHQQRLCRHEDEHRSIAEAKGLQDGAVPKRLCPRSSRRVGESAVDGVAHGRRPLRIGDHHIEVADRTLIARPRLIQIAIVGHDEAPFAGLVIRDRAHDVKDPGSRPVILKRARAKGDPAPDVPAVLLRGIRGDQCAGAGPAQCLESLGQHLEQIRNERHPHAGRLDREHADLLRRLLVGAGQGIGERHPLHTGNRLELLEIGEGQMRRTLHARPHELHIGSSLCDGVCHARLHAL